MSAARDRTDARRDEKGGAAPDPEVGRKPDSPTELSKPSWKYSLKMTVREFMDDQCTDLAAALTYYSVLALFPGLIALISLVGLVGQSEQTVDTMLGLVGSVAPEDVVASIEPVVTDLAKTPAAGLGLITGLLGALWSASGYVGAFSRAMNRIYEIDEGRPFWKLRPVLLLVTVVSVLLIAVAMVLLAVSGPVAQTVGDLVGLGSTAVTVWSILKWPVLAFVVVLLIALLYWATPNVKQPKFKWVSIGALVAIVVWLVASVAFAFYVANFSSYDATYGSLAGVIVFLLFLWISNLALLFGAELDAELERGRQLQAGLPAEEELQLPPRDTTKTDKAKKKHDEDVEQARELRQQGARDSS